MRTMRGYFRQNNRQVIAENGLNSEGLTGRYVGAVSPLQARSPCNYDKVSKTNTLSAVQTDGTNAVCTQYGRNAVLARSSRWYARAAA